MAKGKDAAVELGSRRTTKGTALTKGKLLRGFSLNLSPFAFSHQFNG